MFLLPPSTQLMGTKLTYKEYWAGGNPAVLVSATVMVRDYGVIMTHSLALRLH